MIRAGEEPAGRAIGLMFGAVIAIAIAGTVLRAFALPLFLACLGIALWRLWRVGRDVVPAPSASQDSSELRRPGARGKSAMRPLDEAPAEQVGRVRHWVEKIFGTWKRSYGLWRVRWLGLAKATLQVHLTAVAHTSYRASRM